MNIAADLGGTYLRCGTFDGNRLFDITRTRIATVFDGIAPEEVWASIVQRIADYTAGVSARYGAPERIVIGFPGPVVRESAAVCAPTISGDTKAFDVVTDLRRRCGCDVILLNDVSAASWYLASRLPYERFFVVTVSSGIGSKLVVRTPHTTVIDDVTFAGEIGHITVDTSPNAPACDCGGRGHLGAIASGRGYERAARVAARRDPQAFLTSRASVADCDIDSLTNEADFVPALRADDGWAWDVLRPQLDVLARVLVPIIHAAGVRHVILIGGFATSIGSAYARELERVVQRYTAGKLFGVPDTGIFEVIALDEDACLNGAALYGESFAPAMR